MLKKRFPDYSCKRFLATVPQQDGSQEITIEFFRFSRILHMHELHFTSSPSLTFLPKILSLCSLSSSVLLLPQCLFTRPFDLLPLLFITFISLTPSILFPVLLCFVTRLCSKCLKSNCSALKAPKGREAAITVKY